MSSECLSQYLLNFGGSYWQSSLARSENAGLAASGVRQCGKFGIGFFSVFMIGDEVHVHTRRHRPENTKTVILQVNKGPNSRPIICVAGDQKARLEPGTSIYVHLKSDFQSRDLAKSVLPDGLKKVVEQIAPAADVNILVRGHDGEIEECVRANDWLLMSSEDLCRRLGLRKLYDNLTIIKDNATSDIVGRAGLIDYDTKDFLGGSYYASRSILVTRTGGLTIDETRYVHTAGIFLADVFDAARSSAKYEFGDLNSWLNDQFQILASRLKSKIKAFELNLAFSSWGNISGELPIALFGNVPMTRIELVEFLRDKNHVKWVVDDYDADNIMLVIQEFFADNNEYGLLMPPLSDDALSLIKNECMIVSKDGEAKGKPKEDQICEIIIGAVCEAWGVSRECFSGLVSSFEAGNGRKLEIGTIKMGELGEITHLEQIDFITLRRPT